ncbi:hypothetical protein T484DRAFT_2484996 [Baffinella frigidus]|nr:hypothetical protein T484DRAFT_2484996 [Cryptophyta sp. CCMP2293]
MVPWCACSSVSLLLCSGAGGWYGEMATRALLFSAQIVTLRFRPKYYIVVFFVCFFSMFPVGAITNCAFDHIRKDKTYARCVVMELQFYQTFFFLAGSMTVFFVGRKYANDFSTRRAARESKEQHRALWREELSKVAATPEVTDGLRRLAGGIAQELQEQRRRAVQSLGLVGRVMAFLNQRAGRWLLRGHSIKARQAHGDIDLLFKEAATVNEPFLDLIASLVADIESTDGTAGESDASAGMALKRGPVKKPARALQKLVRLYGRDVAMLTDLVRGTVLAEDLRQVEALIATLAARSVVGLAGAEKRRGGGGEEDPMLDTSDGEGVFRITAIKNRL